MRLHSRLFGTTATILLCWTIDAVAAPAPIRVLQADDHGITLRLDVAEPRLQKIAEGRSVIQNAGFGATQDPGRPLLPLAATLIALPPGARAVARVVDTAPEIVRDDVVLAINGRPFIHTTPEGDGVPDVEPVDAITDGPWPRNAVELGEPFVMRRQRVVPVRIVPFRYDAVGHRLWQRTAVTVRIDFVGGTATGGVASTDRHWDPVLRHGLLNYDQARTWREPSPQFRTLSGTGPRHPGTFGREVPGGVNPATAIEENEPEVRILTDTSGVYSFRYEDLATKGYPANVPVSEVSVHRHEFLENTNPTYLIIEIPIEVDDANQNLVFDAGDRILTYVLSWARRVRASVAERAWGEGEVLYATRVAGRTLQRIPSRPGWRDRTLTPLVSHPFTQRWEPYADYSSLGDNLNTDQFHATFPLLFTRIDSIGFEANDLDTTHAVSFNTVWIGRGFGQHYVYAQIRNVRNQYTTISAGDTAEGFNVLSRTINLNGSAIGEGPTNIFHTWGRGPSSNVAGIALDYFQITYWRYFRALEGTLFCNSGAAARTAFEIRAEGFTSNRLRVYDVTDSVRITRLDIDPSHIEFDGAEYAISFQDSSAGEQRRYIVFDSGKVLPAERYTAVKRRSLADAPAANYIMIVPEAWMDAVAPLAELRRSEGLQVLVAPLESVNDEFNGGRKSSYAIRRFLKYAFDRWNAEFALLCGDGSEDPLNLSGFSGGDYIPIQKVLGPVGSGLGDEVIPGENWFVSFDTQYIPSLFLGRIPAKTQESMAAVVQKIVRYESVLPGQTWRRDMLLLADDPFSAQTTFGGGGGSIDYCANDGSVFLELSNRVRSIIVDDARLTLSNAEVFDMNVYIQERTEFRNGQLCRVRRLQDVVTSCRETVTPQMFDRLNRGVVWWNYQGHANQQVLAHENIYIHQFTDDSERFRNDDRPCFFSAFSCHPNSFAKRGTTIGEDIVMLPNRGAIASYASAGFEYRPGDGVQEHLNTHLARALFADPPRDPLLSDNGSRVVLGEAIGQALADNFSYSLSDREVAISYNLLGDPATRLSIGAPQVVATANGLPVTSGEPVRLLTFGDTLRIEADIASNVSIVALSLEYRANGPAVVIPPSDYQVTPVFPDTGAGSQGGRQFHIVYRTTLTAGSYRYVVRATDRNDVPAVFEIVFVFQTVLRAGDEPLRNGDPVRRDAALSLLVLSPSPIQPDRDMELILNTQPITFVPTPARDDTSGRQWVLSLPPNPNEPGNYQLDVKLFGQKVAEHSYAALTVSRFDNLMAFPNPFDDELGTRFSFTFTGPRPFDLLLRVFTVSGRLIYERTERGLQHSYQQLAWDGRDAEGQKIANGVYLWKLLVKSTAGDVVEQGRLVKLRKPRREVIPEDGTVP